MSGSSSSSPGAGAPEPAAPRAPDDAPLGLTVHSMPDARDAIDASQRQTRVGRLRMLLVMLVCAAPVIASYFTYYVIRPEAKRNHGELIDPQRNLPAVNAITLQGAPVPLASLRDQWLLVSLGGGACDARCERHLYLQRQLREGLGREKDRLDWILLVSDDAPVPEALKPALAQGTVLRVDGAQLAAWLGPLDDALSGAARRRAGGCGGRGQDQARPRAAAARRQLVGPRRPLMLPMPLTQPGTP